MEVSAFVAGEGFSVDESLLLSGRFERGGLFQATLLPGSDPRWRLTLIGAATHGEPTAAEQVELSFPLGWAGPAQLAWPNADVVQGVSLKEESWEPWNPWPAFVDIFESAVNKRRAAHERGLSWQDAIRSLELDDAVRRSIERRRASTLEYPEASEAVGFKGTMTLVGCGLLWGMLLLLILSHWYPQLVWVMLAVLVVFLALQSLRWAIPGSREQSGTTK